MNPSITEQFRSTCQRLQRYVEDPSVQRNLEAAAKSAAQQLVDDPKLAAGVSPLDFSSLPPLPDGVASCRVAAMRPGLEFKRERHDNSEQFLFSISGSGETRVLRGDTWEADIYGTGEPALDSRWHATPRNAWHQSVAHGSDPWILAAFHTATKVHDEYME
jgi:hypothetical protein